MLSTPGLKYLDIAGVCSQKCINNEGSYTCKCDSRFYVREPDGVNCKRSADIRPWLVFTNKYYIRNMTTDATEMRIMHQNLKNVVSMDFHYERNEIYFADVSAKTIYRNAFISQSSAHFRLTLGVRLTLSTTIICDILPCHFAVT